MELSVLDMSLFREGEEANRVAFSNQLVQSFTDHGFVKLIKQGLPEDTVKAYMKAVSHQSRQPPNHRLTRKRPKSFSTCRLRRR